MLWAKKFYLFLMDLKKETFTTIHYWKGFSIPPYFSFIPKCDGQNYFLRKWFFFVSSCRIHNSLFEARIRRFSLSYIVLNVMQFLRFWAMCLFEFDFPQISKIEQKQLFYTLHHLFLLNESVCVPAYTYFKILGVIHKPCGPGRGEGGPNCPC